MCGSFKLKIERPFPWLFLSVSIPEERDGSSGPVEKLKKKIRPDPLHRFHPYRDTNTGCPSKSDLNLNNSTWKTAVEKCEEENILHTEA